MKEINWIELMFGILEGKVSSSARATGFGGDPCFAEILLLESFCRIPAEDLLGMSEESEDYSGNSGIPTLTFVPQPLVLHPEVKGGSEMTLSISSEIPIAVIRPWIEDPQPWNSILTLSPWAGIQNRRSSGPSTTEGPDFGLPVRDKGRGVEESITSDPGIDEVIRDRRDGFVDHRHDEVVSGSRVLVPQYQVQGIQRDRVIDSKSLGSVPGISGYGQRDEGSAPLVDGMSIGVSGYLDEVRDGARDGLVKGGVEVGAEVHRVRSPALDHGRGVEESITSDPGIDEVMRDRGDGFVDHRHDGVVSGSRVLVPQYQVQGIRRDRVIDSKSLGSISDPGISGYGQRNETSAPLVDGRAIGVPNHRDRGEDFGANVLPIIEGEAIDAGSDPKPISNIRPQIQGIQKDQVIDSKSLGSISDPGISGYGQRNEASAPLVDGMSIETPNRLGKIRDGARDGLVKGGVEVGAEAPHAQPMVLDKGQGIREFIASDPGVDEVMMVPNSDDVLIRVSSDEGKSSESMPRVSGDEAFDRKPLVKIQDPGIGDGFVDHRHDEVVSGSRVLVPQYQVQGIQRDQVIEPQSSGILSKNREHDLQVVNSDIHPLIQDNKGDASQHRFSDPQPVAHPANPVYYAFPEPDGKVLPFPSPYRWQEVHEVIERISNAISIVRGTSRRISRIELDISQEEWGKARVRLWTAGDRIFGIVEASDPKFKAILDLELPILKENLARSGVDIEFIAEGAGYGPNSWQMPEQRKDIVWTRDPSGSWFRIQEAPPEGDWSSDSYGSGHIDLWA